jgi:hypothetical protein
VVDRNEPSGTGGAGGHATHDLERIAALLDADLPAADRILGEGMVGACHDCARLRDDLVALASAAAAMPAVERTHDFRLTPADAVRLAATGPGEPSTTATRLGDEMFDPHITARHPAHDTMLVAALVDDLVPAGEREGAQQLVDTCGRCAELHDDLLALRAATRALPTPPRPRDYRLTAADVDRLRPTGLRRWIAAIGSSRDAFTRPLAIGLTTLGIVGLVVSGAPLLSFGGATSSASGEPAAAPRPAASQPAFDVAVPAAGAGNAAAEATRGPVAAAATAPAATAPAATAPAVLPPAQQAPGLAAAPSPPSGDGSSEALGDQSGRAGGSVGGAKATGSIPGAEQDHPVAVTGPQPAEPGPSVAPIVIVSGVLLLAGLGLFLLRWMARRFGA